MPAKYRLGLCFEHGDGVPKNKGEAIKLYAEAADQGDERAQCRLGFCHEKGRGVPIDKEKAEVFYAQAADQGHAEAQRRLDRLKENAQKVSKSTKSTRTLEPLGGEVSESPQLAEKDKSREPLFDDSTSFLQLVREGGSRGSLLDSTGGDDFLLSDDDGVGMEPSVMLSNTGLSGKDSPIKRGG